MHSLNFYLAILILAVVSQRAGCATYPPSWVTNSYVQASNNQIISSLTGNSSRPTYVFTFPRAFPNIPNLGYGIKRYEGSDYLVQQKFQINRTGLTSTTFSVAVQILGITNIYVMNVPFIAINPTFPHHLNSFDNVPVNYSEPLINITTADATGPTYYTNNINYTEQVGSSSPHNTFLTPLTRNKVLLFMTSLFIVGQMDVSGTAYPIDLHVAASVVSIDQYQITVSLSLKAVISKLHFSIIVFDEQDVQSTGLYMLVYKRVDWTNNGGFEPVPFQFQNNFIMGIVDLSGPRTASSIHFQWDFNTILGVQGVYMPVSVGRASNGLVINRVGFTIFYMKTWVCPDQTYFDIATDLCVGCPIINCITCLSEYVCSICDTANGYVLNAVTGQCESGGPITPQTCADCQKVKIERDGCNGFMITVGKQLYQSATDVRIGNTDVQLTKIEEVKTGLQIYAVYTADLVNSAIDLSIGATFSKQIPYNPITPAVLYTQEECDTMENVTRLLKGIEVMSYIVLIFSIVSLKIVGLELFGVLQLSYYTLISHSYFDLYLSPLSKFKTLSGLNVDLVSTNTALLPGQITELGLSSAFLNNFNVMLFLTLLELSVGVVMFFVAKFTISARAKQISVILLKQGFITLIMFNIFNVSFSAGLQWKYDSLNTSFNWANNLVLIACLIGVGVAVTAMELSSSQSHYGEFKKKFKDTWTCRIYILLSILMRASLGIYSALQNEYQESTLFILAIAIVFVMYNLINLPFSDALQNYRACLCHVTMLVILVTTNYYRSMKSNTPILVKAHIHTPAMLEIILIVLCMIVSMAVLTYEIVKSVKKLSSDKIVGDKKSMGHTATHTNLHQITENSLEVLPN